MAQPVPQEMPPRRERVVINLETSSSSDSDSAESIALGSSPPSSCSVESNTPHTSVLGASDLGSVLRPSPCSTPLASPSKLASPSGSPGSQPSPCSTPALSPLPSPQCLPQWDPSPQLSGSPQLGLSQNFLPSPQWDPSPHLSSSQLSRNFCILSQDFCISEGNFPIPPLSAPMVATRSGGAYSEVPEVSIQENREPEESGGGSRKKNFIPPESISPCNAPLCKKSFKATATVNVTAHVALDDDTDEPSDAWAADVLLKCSHQGGARQGQQQHGHVVFCYEDCQECIATCPSSKEKTCGTCGQTCAPAKEGSPKEGSSKEEGVKFNVECDGKTDEPAKENSPKEEGFQFNMESHGKVDDYFVVQQGDNWEERRFWQRDASGRYKKRYVCLLPPCVGEDGSPRSFTRLEYINLHRIRVHALLRLPQIYAARGNALRLSPIRAQISKGGAHTPYQMNYGLGNRAILAFHAELEGACLAHKSLLAASESAFAAHFMSKGSKSEWHSPSRQVPTQCIVCRGDLQERKAKPKSKPSFPSVGSKLSPISISDSEIDELCEKVTSLPHRENKGGNVGRHVGHVGSSEAEPNEANVRTYRTRFGGAPQHNYAEGGRAKKRV